MSKQIFLYSYIGLALVLLAETVYMYYSTNASFSMYYSLSSSIILLTIVIMTIIGSFGSFKFLIVPTIIIFFLNFLIYKFVFMGSMEKFLFTKNKELYFKTVNMVIEEESNGYVYLKGIYSKLSSYHFIEVIREGDHLEIYFGIYGNLASAGKIVYTNDMEKLLKQNKLDYTKHDVIDKNWCIFHY